jgi:hypothetical protein
MTMSRFHRELDYHVHKRGLQFSDVGLSLTETSRLDLITPHFQRQRMVRARFDSHFPAADIYVVLPSVM